MVTITLYQFSQEIELTHDDVSYLLDQLSENIMNASFDSKTSTNGNGLDTGNMKVIYQHKWEHFEQQVTNDLSNCDNTNHGMFRYWVLCATYLYCFHDINSWIFIHAFWCILLAKLDLLFPNKNNSNLIPIVEALCKNGYLSWVIVNI